MSKESIINRYLEKTAKTPKKKHDYSPKIEDEPYLSQAAKELIGLAEEFGENLAQEVEKDHLLKLINDLRRRDIPLINKVLRQLGFDISPIVYGSLKDQMTRHLFGEDASDDQYETSLDFQTDLDKLESIIMSKKFDNWLKVTDENYDTNVSKLGKELKKVFAQLLDEIYKAM